MFFIEGKFYEVISKLADLAILNLLFAISCIPIVTIGAATTALYGVTGKMAENSEGYIVKTYFKLFRENFRQSTIMWMILLTAGSIAATDLYIIGNMPKGMGQTVLKGLAMLAIIVVSFVFLYAMALQSTFDNTLKNTIKNALLLGIGYFPWTLLIMVVAVLPLITLMFMENFRFAGWIIMILLWFSGSAYINSYIFHHIFKKYM